MNLYRAKKLGNKELKEKYSFDNIYFDELEQGDIIRFYTNHYCSTGLDAFYADALVCDVDREEIKAYIKNVGMVSLKDNTGIGKGDFYSVYRPSLNKKIYSQAEQIGSIKNFLRYLKNNSTSSTDDIINEMSDVLGELPESMLNCVNIYDYVTILGDVEAEAKDKIDGVGLEYVLSHYQVRDDFEYYIYSPAGDVCPATYEEIAEIIDKLINELEGYRVIAENAENMKLKDYYDKGSD